MHLNNQKIKFIHLPQNSNKSCNVATVANTMHTNTNHMNSEHKVVIVIEFTYELKIIALDYLT